MNEKGGKRGHASSRFGANSSRAVPLSKPASGVGSQRGGMRSSFSSALPSLQPTEEDKVQQLKLLFYEAIDSITQFISHSSSSSSYRTNLQLSSNEIDSLFQNFFSQVSKLHGNAPILQHGHNQTDETTQTNAIKNVANPFLKKWVYFASLLTEVKESGFKSIVEGISDHFDIIFKTIEKLGNLPSKVATTRDNSKKISQTLRGKANEIHSQIRKIINSEISEKQTKQVANMVHEFSQSYVTSLSNDFSLAMSNQENDTVRNDVLAALNDIIQGVRCMALFEADISHVTTSFKSFENKLVFFISQIGLKMPSANGEEEEEEDTDIVDFDESMTIHEIISAAEAEFPKQVPCSNSMLRFFSLLKGKVSELEQKGTSTKTNDDEIKKIQQQFDMKAKQMEATVQRLNKALMDKNDDIYFLQNNPSMQYLQEVTTILMGKGAEVDLADPYFMKKLTDSINNFKNKSCDVCSNAAKALSAIVKVESDDLMALIEKVKKQMEQSKQEMEINTEEVESANKTAHALTDGLNEIVAMYQNPPKDIQEICPFLKKEIMNERAKLKQQIEKEQNDGKENIQKYINSLAEKISSLMGTPPKDTIDEQLEFIARDRKNENDLLSKFQILSRDVEERLAKYLGESPPNKPITESIQQLLSQLEKK